MPNLSSFRRANVVHTIVIQTRTPGSQQQPMGRAANLGLLARLEGELLHLRGQLARLTEREQGAARIVAEPGSGAQPESHTIRSLRRRIESLEGQLLGTMPAAGRVLHEFGVPDSELRSTDRRQPRHTSIDLPDEVVDEEAQELKSSLLAEMLSANLALREALGQRRPGA